MAQNEQVNIKATITADTSGATSGVSELKKELSNTSKETNKLSGANFENLKNSLTSISPAAKSATEGASLFNNALNILKANPIIAVIAVLAGVVIGLFQKFKQMESVSDALGKAFGTLSGIFNQFLNNILTPLIDGFVKMTELVTGGLTKALDFLGISSKKTADRFGEITDALDDLTDSEKNAAIATAESNRKLQEAREIAGDANVPIKERIAALQEAGKIEKEELDKVVKMNQLKAQLTMESIAMELGARQGLIDMIKSGSLEQLKAARIELASLKNVDKEKLYAIDQQIIAAENAGAQSAKIGKKTQSAITSLEREEESKREAIRKEAESKAKARREKELADAKKHLEDLTSITNKYIKDLEDLQDKSEKQKLDRQRQRDIRELEAKKFSKKEEQDVLELINKKYEILNTQLEAKTKEEKDKKDKDAHDSFVTNLNKKADAQLASDNARIKSNKDAADQTLADDTAIFQARRSAQMEFANAVGAVLSQLSSLFEQGTAASKIAALAEIALGTATGFINGLDIAQKGAKGTGPAAPFAFPIFYATQIAAVLGAIGKAKQALSQVKAGGGGAGSTPSPPNIPAPVTPQQMNTQLNAASIQGIGQAAAGGINRSFVLETDISNNQERASRLNRAARLG